MTIQKFRKHDIRQALYEEESPLRLVEEGDWIAEGKYDFREVVFQYDLDDCFYAYYESRSGSPFSDYHYTLDDEPDEIELARVEKSEKVITYWKTVD